MSRLIVRPEFYSIARMKGGEPVGLSSRARFASISRLGDETTIVCPAADAPAGSEVCDGLRLIEVDGDFALDSIGGVAGVAGPLAMAGVSLFAFSVWNTDAFLVQAADLERAKTALLAAGHTLAEP